MSPYNSLTEDKTCALRATRTEQHSLPITSGCPYSIFFLAFFPSIEPHNLWSLRQERFYLSLHVFIAARTVFKSIKNNKQIGCGPIDSTSTEAISKR